MAGRLWARRYLMRRRYMAEQENNQLPITKHQTISHATTSAAPSKNENDVSRIFHQDEHGVGLFPANTLIRSSGLHSLALGFGTFAYAKGQASSPHDGLLKERFNCEVSLEQQARHHALSNVSGICHFLHKIL